MIQSLLKIAGMNIEF